MKVLAVPDIHFPFADPVAIKALIRFAKQYRPHVVVCLGDELDLYSLSRYPRSVSVITPADEYLQGMNLLRAFWKAMRKACGRKTKFVTISSNHVDRLRKRVLEKLPEVEPYLLKDPFHVDGVKRIEGEIILDGVMYLHGYRGKSVDHAKYAQMSTVHGHSHQAGLTYLKNVRGPYFAMECGWLGDETLPVYSYKQQALTTWNKAWATITDGAPALHLYIPPRRTHRRKSR